MVRCVIINGHNIEPGANLSGASLIFANLTNATLNGAYMGENTMLPDGHFVERGWFVPDGFKLA